MDLGESSRRRTMNGAKRKKTRRIPEDEEEEEDECLPSTEVNEGGGEEGEMNTPSIHPRGQQHPSHSSGREFVRDWDEQTPSSPQDDDDLSKSANSYSDWVKMKRYVDKLFLPYLMVKDLDLLHQVHLPNIDSDLLIPGATYVLVSCTTTTPLNSFLYGHIGPLLVGPRPDHGILRCIIRHFVELLQN